VSFRGALRSPELCSGNRRFRLFGNHLAFVLCYGRRYVNGEPGRLRHNAGNEVGAVLRQGGDKRNVAGKPVKTYDEKRGAALVAFRQAGEELRPVPTNPGTARRCTSIPNPLAPCRSVDTR
jgi:hypothetical protein